MTVMTLVCHSCGAPRPPGALLEVVPVNRFRSSFPICRPSLDARCFRLAGRTDQAGIRMLDRAAAEEFDRSRGW